MRETVVVMGRMGETGGGRFVLVATQHNPDLTVLGYSSLQEGFWSQHCQ